MPFLQLWSWLCSVKHAESIVSLPHSHRGVCIKGEFTSGWSCAGLFPVRTFVPSTGTLHLGRGSCESLTLCPLTGQLRPGAEGQPPPQPGKHEVGFTQGRTGIFPSILQELPGRDSPASPWTNNTPRVQQRHAGTQPLSCPPVPAPRTAHLGCDIAPSTPWHCREPRPGLCHLQCHPEHSSSASRAAGEQQTELPALQGTP